jgi:hypothetical protein
MVDHDAFAFTRQAQIGDRRASRQSLDKRAQRKVNSAGGNSLRYQTFGPTEKNQVLKRQAELSGLVPRGNDKPRSEVGS